MKKFDEYEEYVSLNRIKELSKHMFGQANTLVLPRILLAMTGDHVSAILLNQILYWSERTRDPEGWFYKRADDWYRELGITYFQLTRAVKDLKRLGVETKVRKVRGTPTSHYRIRNEIFYSAFLNLLENYETRNSEKSKIGKPRFSNSEELKVLDSLESEKSINKEAENTSKSTHIQRTTQAAPDNQGVGVSKGPVSYYLSSRHSISTLEEYFKDKKRAGAKIDPAAVARARAKDGLEDEHVDIWIEQKSRATVDKSKCPVCHGAGVYYPDGYERGAKRCYHDALFTTGA